VKNSKKILIERYVNLRCKKLQEQSVWDHVKSTAHSLNQFNPMYMMANQSWDMGKDVVDTYRDYKSGEVPKDQVLSAFGGRMLDRVQTGLDGAGMVPAWGAIPDLANAGISQIRASLSSTPEQKRKHNINKAFSLGAATPLVGLGIGGTKYLMKNAPNLANNITNISSKIKYNPAFTPTKVSTKAYKADQKGHVTGEKGEVTNAITNVTQPAVNQIKQAGPSGILKNLYNKYIKGDSNPQLNIVPKPESNRTTPGAA